MPLDRVDRTRRTPVGRSGIHASQARHRRQRTRQRDIQGWQVSHVRRLPARTSSAAGLSRAASAPSPGRSTLWGTTARSRRGRSSMITTTRADVTGEAVGGRRTGLPEPSSQIAMEAMRDYAEVGAAAVRHARSSAAGTHLRTRRRLLRGVRSPHHRQARDVPSDRCVAGSRRRSLRRCRIAIRSTARRSRSRERRCRAQRHERPEQRRARRTDGRRGDIPVASARLALDPTRCPAVVSSDPHHPDARSPRDARAVGHGAITVHR